jgi:hypothetical protein
MKTLLAQSRRLTLTLLCTAGLAVAASAVHATELTVPRDQIRLDGSIGRTVDPYTDGARVGKVDLFTEGANIQDPRSSFTDGANINDPRSSFSDGA